MKKAAVNAQPAGRKGMKKVIKENKGFCFILPWLIGFLIFKVYPFGSSLFYSFTDYHLFDGISKFGLMNYDEIIHTKKIVKAFVVTMKYAFMTVPLKLVFALFIAYILNFKLKGVNLFRTAYYIPSILGGSIAIAVLWKAVFKDDGIINMLLGYIGIEGPNWLASPPHALFVISLLRVWQFGSAMVIFLAALKGIPAELYEAASIDGSGKWNQFLHITLPQISSVVFFNLIMQSIQALQNFTSAFVITGGGPMKRTYIIGMKLYDDAFRFYKVGYACAESWILFLVILALTLLVFKSSDAWVYYADEGGSKK